MMKAKWVNSSARHSGESRNPAIVPLPTLERWIPAFAGMTILLFSLTTSSTYANDEEQPVVRNYTAAAPAPAFQTWDEAHEKSAGCVSCHTRSDRKTMHASEAVVLGCIDCHGGDAKIFAPSGQTYSADDHHDKRDWSTDYHTAMDKAHVLPRYPDHWATSANPQRSYTWWLKEAPEFVRFVNPGDLRIATESCGACHLPIIQANQKSLMSNAAMFWGAAAYNNGILPYKHSVLGEAYTRDGVGATTDSGISLDDNMKEHGILPKLYPLPAWEITPPGDIFRIFERGGRNISNHVSGDRPARCKPASSSASKNPAGPTSAIQPRPRHRRAHRNSGAQHHQDASERSVPVVHGHQRSIPAITAQSGCAACHVVYANDRDTFAFQRLRQVRQHAACRRRRSDHSHKTNPDIRSSTTSPARFPPANA